MFRSFLLVLCAVVASLAVGCAAGDAPPLAQVEGTVTLGGEPLPNALVTFTPEGTGAPSYGRTDQNGWYELIYSRTETGAMLGEHRVMITTYEPGGDDDEEGSGAAETVPAQYNVESELTRTVEPGRNSHDFELEEDGEIVQPSDET